MSAFQSLKKGLSDLFPEGKKAASTISERLLDQVGSLKRQVMGRNKIEKVEIKEHDNVSELVNYTVIDERMALPIGYEIKQKKRLQNNLLRKVT
jgi:hypothetical protein